MIDEAAFRRAYADLRARLAWLEVASGFFVPDEYLDTRKGDPVVPFMPQNWQGEDMKGKAFSLCSPELLDAIASMLWRMANKPKPGKEEYSARNRRMSAVARTWARRLRRQAPQDPHPVAMSSPDEDYLT